MGTKEVGRADFAKKMVEAACEHRMGKAPELGFAIADERNGHPSGVDVLIDGGASSGKRFRALVCAESLEVVETTQARAEARLREPTLEVKCEGIGPAARRPGPR